MKQQALNDKLDEVNRGVEAGAADKEALSAEIEVLQAELNQAVEDKDRLSSNLAALGDNKGDLEGKVAEKEQLLDNKKKDLAALREAGLALAEEKATLVAQVQLDLSIICCLGSCWNGMCAGGCSPKRGCGFVCGSA